MTNRLVRTRVLLAGLALEMAAGFTRPVAGQTDYHGTAALEFLADKVARVLDEEKSRSRDCRG